MGGAQPDQRIEDLMMAVVDMQQAIAGLLAQPRDPPVTHGAQIIEPGKAEIAQVEEEEAVPG